MEITVEHLDDINIILKGTIKQSIIDKKISQMEKTATQTEKDDTQTQETPQDKAEGEILKEFIDTGLKKGNIDVETLLGHPAVKKYERREDGRLYLEIQLSTSPQIDTDIDYKKLIPTFTKPEANKQMIQERLRTISKEHVPYTPIENPRPVQEEDVAVIDFEGFIEGKAFDGGKAENFNLKVGAHTFTSAFDEQIIGMQYNQSKEITINFPKDYTIEELAGKESVFKVTLKEIKEQKASAIDDAFAQQVLKDDTANLEILHSTLKKQIDSELLSKLYIEELKPKITKAFLTHFDFTLPLNIIEQEIDAIVNEKLQEMTEKDAQMYKEDKAKFHVLRDSVRSQAEEAIKMALIVETLAKKESVEVTEEEMISTLYYQATKLGQDPKELVEHYKKNNLMTTAMMRLTEDKLLGKLLGFTQ